MIILSTQPIRDTTDNIRYLKNGWMVIVEVKLSKTALSVIPVKVKVPGLLGYDCTRKVKSAILFHIEKYGETMSLNEFMRFLGDVRTLVKSMEFAYKEKKTP